MTNNTALINWIQECVNLCQPDDVVWWDGSEEQKERLEKEAFGSGELIQLDQQKLPGCVLHRTAQNDVARTEHLTYICTSRKEDAGPTNNWMSHEEGYSRAAAFFKGSMKGRKMYVVPFSMGPVGSPFSKIGVELTDSIYVVLNMRIMCHTGQRVLDALGDSDNFTRGLHSKADLDVDKRLILHFPEDNTIWSVGSGYGGNVLLGKKCLSLRIASFLGRNEGWMAEHMLILGIQDPEGKTTYIAGAFPSACGKTNLAMLVPPDCLKERGYKVFTLGDDICWLRMKEDGRLWAINPEAGFFGVVPGTNYKTNPNAMATIQKNTIFTNVVLKPDNTIWWEGLDNPPQQGIGWTGQSWKPGMVDAEGKPVKGAHPNSRFTAPASQCPSIAPNWQDPEGVPISAFLFGGRRARVAPLVYQSYNWQHGVFVGASMASERTAAQYGKQGEVRRDPMAMLPFCGYNMADYFGHWLEMGKKLSNPPKIFHVNWFRTGADGKLLWPGFGENLRVVDWIANRCCDEGAGATETPIGYVPRPEDLDLCDLNTPAGSMEQLLSVSAEDWTEEVQGIGNFFTRFGNRLPDEMWDEHQGLKMRFGF